MINPPSPDNGSLPLDVEAQVDQICDRFENAWKQGQRPRIEDFLAALAEPGRSTLLRELIKLDIVYRRLAGENPTAEDYRERFPDLDPPVEVSTVLESPGLRHGPAAPGPVPVGAPSTGRYQMGDEIGRGGMGTVLRGRDPELDRDLAIKVLRRERQDQPDAVRRFLEEARIAGRLQHPGIVPIYDLGRFPDQRPFFTMKLVQGRTLAELLAQRPDPSHDLPRFLKIFEQVCQTLAYAHSKGVLHRDLKPSNVMVGAFGEVQVMDWGLAKVLASGGCQPPGSDTYRGVDNPRSQEPSREETQEGNVLGTPGYMAPEQARGEVDKLDERCDVFGLGAILCVILTGKPPYRGERAEVLNRARQADQADALARLDRCGADADLLQLAKTCLAREAEGRPRDAGAVAEAVTAYLVGVQERLRQAELARAAAQARAEEERKLLAQERKARRLTAALAVSVILLALLGVGAWRWLEHHQEVLKQEQDERLAEARRGASRDLKKARELLVAALAAPPGDLTRWTTALAMVRQAQGRLGDAEGNDDLRQQARELAVELERHLQEQRQQGQDQRMAARLEEVRLRQTAVKDGHFDAEPAEAEYRLVFREYGIDVEKRPPAEVAARVRQSAIRVLLAAALDDWARLKSDPEERQRFFEMARLADPGDSLRDRVRAALAGKNRKALLELAHHADVAQLPAATLHLLASGLRRAGETAEAVALLWQARRRHPADFWINHNLALYLWDLSSPNQDKAIGFYRAALALRPQSPGVHVNLGAALLDLGSLDDALAAFNKAIELQKDYAEAYVARAAALLRLNRLEKARADCDEALRLKPGLSEAYNNLGAVLSKQGHRDKALAAYRKAVASGKPFAGAYGNLGTALLEAGRIQEGLAALDQAVRIDPHFAQTYNNLGTTFLRKGEADAALALFKKVIKLQPKDPEAHYHLGLAWSHKRLSGEAIACFRQALDLKPEYAAAHTYLGRELDRQGLLDDAIAAHEKAIGLNPNYAIAHNHLGVALGKKGLLGKALASCRKAVQLDPTYVDAWCNVGRALTWKRLPDEAIAACKKAVELDKDCAQAHNNLGVAYRLKGLLEEAEAEFREALRLQPDDYQAWNNLGALLCDHKRDYDGAIKAFQEGLKHNPKLAELHCNLANALSHRGVYDEAIAAYRQAILLEPKHTNAHFNLAITLFHKGMLDEAVAAFRKTIEVEPGHALAHCYLGLRLREKGRFAEALKAVKRGHELGSKSPRWSAPSGRWIEACERDVELEKRLPAILRGEDKPADGAEGIELAWMCSRKGMHGASAHFSAQAFAAQPKLADDLRSGDRYNAACSAALAGCGRGEDAAELEDGERARLRQQALDWLRADLKLWTKLVDKAQSQDLAAALKRLRYWQHDPALAGLRDEKALAKLPEAEQQACRQLWADVAALLKRTAAEK
jgi:serine/threonine-protein kinase